MKKRKKMKKNIKEYLASLKQFKRSKYGLSEKQHEAIKKYHGV